MRHGLAWLTSASIIGCSMPPPTSTAAVATEPTTLFWGDLESAGAASAQSQLDPPLDFVVVAGPAGGLWKDTIETAAADNEMCVFTSFIGWESGASGDDTTRLVTFMSGGAEQARQFSPSPLPPSEALSAWITKTSDAVSADFVTVPATAGAQGATDSSQALTLTKAGQVGFDGLVAAWAEENTRTSIFAAFERNEIYATTGPRIRLRFFGGWAFNGKLAKAPGMVRQGYTLGYPMGAHLPQGPDGKAPGFLMYAIKDPKGADLDRIQIVKGWLDDAGTTHEEVYDAVLPKVSEPSRKERKKGVVPTPADELSAPSLYGFWADAQFDPTQQAYYYVRALEKVPPGSNATDDLTAIPTARGHAHSAAIWYVPAPPSEKPSTE